MDFSENYSYLVQDVVQGYYWDNSQSTLHPFSMYHKSLYEIKHESFCIISDCLKHDSVAVHVFLNNLNNFLKEKISFITHIHYFSDGAVGQYKNY